MARVYGYIRVSSDHQDWQRQKVLIRKYCDEHELTLVDFIGEKVSGAKVDRSGLNDVFQLTKNKADIVIISELSRLSREDDILNVMSEINTIRRNGLDLYILDSDTWIRTTDTIGGMQAMQLVFTAEGNAKERKKIADRMKTGRYAKLKKNHYAYVGGQVPFGFMVVPNENFDETVENDKEPRSVLKENKEQSKILRMMYNKIASGYTLHRLAKEMIDNGIVISGGQLTNYQTLISDILHNKLYVGERSYKDDKGKPEVFQIEPLIPRSLYNDAIESLKKNRWVVSYSSNFNPLKGLLFCTCGRSLYHTNCKNYWYYKCYKKKDDNENQICSNSGVKSEKVFNAIWEAAKNIMSQEEFQLQTSEREAALKQELQMHYDDLAQIQLEIVRKQKAVNGYVKKIEALENTDLIKQFEEKYSQAKSELDELNKKKGEHGLKFFKIREKIQELARVEKEERLDSLSLEYKSELLHKVVDKAIWCSDRLRRGFLQITYINGLVETLLIQTDKTHSLILQLPTSMQLDLNERKVRVEGELYSYNDFLKKFDYSEWIIEETIVNGFTQRKDRHDKKTDDELERLASEALD